MREIECDIAIIGGSLGGCAAASQVSGFRAVLTEQTDWIGGQITSQGVSALDEHAHIETFGATRGYMTLRDSIRQVYHQRHDVPLTMDDSVLGSNMPLNPGNGWVSRLCFLPEIGKECIEQLYDPDITHFLNCRPVDAVLSSDGMIDTLILDNAAGEQLHIRARYYLDATDTGDLLPLSGLDYVTGAESRAQTGEPSALDDPRPNETQGFTYCFAVEYCDGENHTIDKPAGYEQFRMQQPYTLSPVGRDGEPVVYRMFEKSRQGNLPFWTYRRIHDGTLFGGNDISLINWVSNDYHGGNILDATDAERERYLDEAKRLSLGFLYWLQTECPRDDGGQGYPEFRLRTDIMATDDGLSKAPYIRESRRIVPLRRIVEQDISAEFNTGARATHMSDSAGIGWYAMDLHPCVGNPSISMYAPTKPFQIPLSALLPKHDSNVLPACKNIGTTHLTNGAYRLHPIEWGIGEAAAIQASFCLNNHLRPRDVYRDPWQIWRLQYQLVQHGCPIVWAIDVPLDNPLFMATQLLLVRDIIVPESDRWHSLYIRPDVILGDSIDIQRLNYLLEMLTTAAEQPSVNINPDITWQQLCWRVQPLLNIALQDKSQGKHD